jgi:hypothetical protein
VHWASDVVIGWSVGLAWVLAVSAACWVLWKVDRPAGWWGDPTPGSPTLHPPTGTPGRPAGPAPATSSRPDEYPGHRGDVLGQPVRVQHTPGRQHPAQERLDRVRSRRERVG